MTETLPVRLDDVIAAITRQHDDVLDRLSGAVLLAGQLEDVADQLIGHFVDQARRSGASWSDIGRSMGVSKQAVQKRFTAKLDPSQGFSRFTDGARRVVVEAQNRAKAAGNDRISVGHLILALTADPTSKAATMISSQDLDLDQVRHAATATLPPRADSVPRLVPFDAHAREILESTFEEAASAGQERVDTEQILLAIMTVEAGTGVLAGLGVDEARLRRDLQSGAGPAQPD
jgi:Clp amino terminal domain, pathogenicity island component